MKEYERECITTVVLQVLQVFQRGERLLQVHH